ncbi:MAG: hypothetical protein R3282_04380, partial [Rhodothermales bacterium]|nr:hypothetical protein [Rhodothermales bacterium]
MLTVVAVVAGLTSIIVPRLRTDTYLPGEKIEGITSVLDRVNTADAPPIIFEDVTERSGIDFRHFPYTRTSKLPEDMGSGVAWGDFDNDGWQDVYLAN